jgi:hypothetical protein
MTLALPSDYDNVVINAGGNPTTPARKLHTPGRQHRTTHLPNA